MEPVALITGGASGIGYGIAEALANEGCHLILCGRRQPADVQEQLEALKRHALKVDYIRADISIPVERDVLLAKIHEIHGYLHILVNNAGVAPDVRADLLEASEASFERVLRINLQGPYFLTQAVARWMIRQKQHQSDFQGCIVNISSISAEVASPNRGEYCVSKAGVSMATKLWAVRLSEFGIPVYEVRPGIIATDMTAGVQGKYDRLIEEGLLLEKRWGLPEDIGKAVAVLVKGQIPYASGQVLTLDGGLTLPRL